MFTNNFRIHWGYVFSVLLLSGLLIGCVSTNQFLNMGGASGTKENLPVNVEILVEMAEYCEKIYEDGEEIRDNEFSYNVVQDRGVTIVIIRGTDNGRNVLTDLDVRPFQDRKLSAGIHRGFRDAAEKVKNDLIENHAIEETVIFTGHSLGGAVAQLLGLWFEDDAYEIQIYTFGAPAVIMEPVWEDGHFRVYLENDPVPFLPPYPYVHWGIRINAETLNWDEAHPIGDITKIDGRDHSIKEYLNTLRKHESRGRIGDGENKGTYGE